MNLQNLLDRFPGVKLAQARDDDRIRHFFHTRSMHSKNFYLTYDRNPSFFDFLKLQGFAFYVFFVENEDGVIEGCGSLSIRHGQHQGQNCHIGYLSDLRINNIRKWGRVWREFYEALITHANQIVELAAIKIFYTCLLQDNKKAYNSLVLNKTNLSYTLFHNYQMINVFASLLPFAVKNYQVKRWNELTLAELTDFYQKYSAKTPYAYCFEGQHNEIERRISLFPGFDLKNGVAFCQNGEILAACSFWSPHMSKKIIMHNQSKRMLFFGKFLNLPKNEQELKCFYLFGLQYKTNLSQKLKMDLLKQIISIGLKHAHQLGYHCLSFSHFQTSHQLKLFPTFISHSTKLAMYVVHPKNDQLDLNFERTTPPAFEIGLI